MRNTLVPGIWKEEGSLIKTIGTINTMTAVPRLRSNLALETEEVMTGMIVPAGISATTGIIVMIGTTVTTATTDHIEETGK